MKQILSVVVGRFQVPKLHAGHSYLLDTAQSAGQLLVVLGSPAGLPDARNPLSFQVRKDMIKRVYPKCLVAEIKDCQSDAVWSARLDDIVSQNLQGRQAMMFGSRDSFIGSYRGAHPATIIPELSDFNGTLVRESLAHRDSVDYRVGHIMAQRERRPISYQAVDVAVIRHETKEVLLGKKKDDLGLYRLIGGFVEPSDASLESAARRELQEEAGRVDTHKFEYLGSYRVDDHRYRSSADKIMSALFATYHFGGRPQAGDDIDEVSWVPLADILDVIIPAHQPLGERLVEFVN